ncbi:hypothetical protein D3C72_1643000 [compost metagenome]
MIAVVWVDLDYLSRLLVDWLRQLQILAWDSSLLAVALHTQRHTLTSGVVIRQHKQFANAEGDQQLHLLFIKHTGTKNRHARDLVLDQTQPVTRTFDKHQRFGIVHILLAHVVIPEQPVRFNPVTFGCQVRQSVLLLLEEGPHTSAITAVSVNWKHQHQLITLPVIVCTNFPLYERQARSFGHLITALPTSSNNR